MNKRFFNQQNLTRRLRLLSVLFAMVIIPNMAWGQWDTKTFTFNGATDDILYAAVNDETIGYSWNFHIDGHYCAALVESKVKISVRDNYGKGVLTPPDGFTIKKVTLNYSNLEVTEGSKIYVRAVNRTDTTTHYTDPYLMTSDGTLDINLNAEGISSDNLCFLIFSDNDKAYSYILNSITITKIADYHLSIGGVSLTGSNVNPETGAVTGLTGVYFTPANNTVSPATPATLTLNGANLTEGITTSIDGLVIDLIGDNTITSSTQAPIKGTGDTEPTLTLKSSGTTVGSLKLIPTEASNYNITQDATLSLENPLVRCDDGNNVYFEEGYQLIVGGIQMSKHQDIAGKIGGISTNNAYNHETNTLTLDGWHNDNASIVSGLPVLNIKLMGTNSFSYIMANTDIEGTKTLVFQTEDSESVLALAEAISGFNNVTYQNNLVFRTIIGDEGETFSVETISKPTMTGDGSNVTFTFNAGMELHYSIDYAKEGVADVTDATISTSGTSVALSGPCTVTAYTKWNNSQSDEVVGKLFGFATESVSGYAGQESIPFSLVPAINVATDGLTLETQTGNENIVAAVNDAYDTIILGEGLGLTYFRVTMKPGAETPYTILNYIYEGTANIGPLDVKVSVAEPTVSPDATGGPFNIGQLVTLGYEYEPSNDVHSIKYIVGEDLTVAPTTYTAPFALNETAAVNAWVETTYSGNKYSSDTVTVNYAIKQDPKLKVSYTWYSLRFGETFSQEVTSDMPTTPTVTWSSSNTDVATVDPTTGVVTPVAAYGSDIEITATFAGDDTWSAASVSYAIRVNKAEQYLRIKYKGTNIPLSTVKVEKGNPIDIKTEYDFSCPEELVGTLVWYSNDENVVTVTNGVITTVGCGSTWIKVSSAGNSNYESHYCDFNIEVAPPKPTINLAEGTYMSTHDPITITKADIANTAITYTWDDVTDYNVSPTWKDYTDAGVALQKTGTLYARVGYTTNDEGVIYSDTASVAYTVIPDIAECTVSGNDNVTYTGAAQTPTITVTPAGGGETLVLGTDYTVSYKKGETAVESMIDAGDYTIVITAKEGSAYGGTKEVGFTIAQAKLSAVTIAAIDDQTFTGSQITPAVTVTFNEKTVSTEEYNVVYGENKNVGEGAGTVTLTSKNKNFVTSTDADATTKQTATFNIVAATAAITATDQTVTFNGEERPFTNYTIANGEAVVTYYSSEEARTAQSGGTTNAPTNAAIYYVQVTQGDDNYTSAPANATFTISPKALTSEMVILSATSFVYSGAAQTPDVTVADGDNILTINTNYDYVIKQGETVVASPMNVGSYSVVVTGKGNYSGTATQTFTIAAKDLASATVTVDATQTYTYTGAAIEPNVSSVSIKLTEGADVATNLTAGTDYTVTGYANNTDAALATAETNAPTVTITGKGNFTGTATGTFTIAQAKLSAVTIAAIGNQTFTGSQITPGVTVTFNEKTVSTDEYNVVYGDNINAGENAGTVTLTSKNKNFVTSTDEDATTKKTATFNIVAATAAITATDQTVTFNGGAQEFTNYTIANGEAAVTYYSSEEARTAQSGGTTSAPTEAAIYYVQVTQGDANYTSNPANATFTISPKALTEGMVEQDGVSFTYSGYTPEYSVSVKDGEEDLAGDDYDCVIKQGGTEIIPVNAGSYDVVVTGKRNYTGTITKTLTITKAQLTVTPDDKTYNVGDNIELTVSYDGFVDGDDEDVLTTEPTASYGTADVTKPGSYEITASGGVAQNYDFIYGTGTLTINRQLTVSFSASNTWATYCGTENLSTPEGLKAYQVTAVEGATVTISEIGYIPANTAVLLQNVSNNNVWTNIAASAYTGATSTFENNKLIGTASAVDVSTITGGTVYILVNNMFRRSTSGSIPANRGYLVVAMSSNAPQLSISIGDENTTGVQTLNVERGTLNDDSWYTIDGRKLQQAPVQKGLYIKNGKKVFINKK